jgi:hypothetical protein
MIKSLTKATQRVKFQTNLMPANIQPILDEILTTAKSAGISSDKENIQQFLLKEINSDDLVNYLVIGAALSKDRKGLLVYLLTSTKLVKIEIDQEKIQSLSSYLKEITAVSRTLANDPTGNNAKISVEFPQGSFGLQYSTTLKKIDSFFQNVDEAVRKLKGPTNGK